MQKIMFNDRFSLTDLVLSGRKTQTRRIIKGLKKGEFRCFSPHTNWAEFSGTNQITVIAPLYCIGEKVAVAMSYKSIYERVSKTWEYAEEYKREHENLAGWNNKMFTNTKMPFATIKITNIRIERLQDISDEDCLKEGIRIDESDDIDDFYYFENFSRRGLNNIGYYADIREAYADLIDKINGKGTWASNPYVWVYDFELVK